jgi:hypothetical protein
VTTIDAAKRSRLDLCPTSLIVKGKKCSSRILISPLLAPGPEATIDLFESITQVSSGVHKCGCREHWKACDCVSIRFK